MSKPTLASSPTPERLPKSHPGPKLSPIQRQAVIAAVASGQRQSDVAAQFGIHPNSVNAMVRRVRNTVPDSALAPWRERFQVLTPKSVDAIERALDDKTDSYKAAAVAQAHLKGVGVYQAESQQNNVFIGQVTSLPPDWAEQFVSSDATEPPAKTDESQ